MKINFIVIATITTILINLSYSKESPEAFNLSAFENLPFEIQINIFEKFIRSAATQKEVSDYLNKYSAVSSIFKTVTQSTLGQKIVLQKQLELEGMHDIDIVDGLHGINSTNNGGMTALMWASQNLEKPSKAIEKLLALGASVDREDKDGNTAFMHSIHRKDFFYTDVKTANALLKAGANINHKNNNDDTALLRAYPDTDETDYLIKNHADLTIKNKDGLDAYERAQKNHYVQMGTMIWNAMSSDQRKGQTPPSGFKAPRPNIEDID